MAQHQLIDYDNYSNASSDQQLKDIDLRDDSRYIPKTRMSRKKKICLFSVLGCGLCCLVLCIVILIAGAVYFGRKNVNIYPTPEYSSSDDFLHFLLVGDMGRADEGQKNVAASMGKFCNVKKCHFVIGIGDNIYNYGVESVDDEQFKTKFEDIYNVDGIKDLKWHMLIGNHVNILNFCLYIIS